MYAYSSILSQLVLQGGITIFLKMSLEKITGDWKKKVFKPIYWLEGEEPYFIDKIVDYAEHNILSESEASFNLTIFYGKDANWTDVVNACRRYPMFAERQVVLLKEAQHMKDIIKLESYVANPLPSTVLVVAHKEGKLDGKTKMAKLLKTNAEVFLTKKLYESDLPAWIAGMISGKGLQIKPAALELLKDNIGNDLNRLENEIEKVCINLGNSTMIDENAIEKYVGISKEFNVFELQNAIGKKDLGKCIRIIRYFQSNPKAGAIQLLLPSIYGYFSKVYCVFGMADKSINTLKPLFNNNYYAAQDGLAASKAFGQQGVEKVLLLLHEYNLKSVGVNSSNNTDPADLMKEMVVKMVC